MLKIEFFGRTILILGVIIMKKHTVVGTDIREVKRLNLDSQKGGDKASGLPMQGGMDVSDE